MRQVQFNLEYLTTRESTQKGDPTPLSVYALLFFFFQVTKRIPSPPTSFVL